MPGCPGRRMPGAHRRLLPPYRRRMVAACRGRFARWPADDLCANGRTTNPELLGEQLAQQLLDQGAGAILGLEEKRA